jgi:hypothetical protein
VKDAEKISTVAEEKPASDDDCDADCDAEDDEVAISKQKKMDFEKPVQTAGPEGKNHDFRMAGELEEISTKSKQMASVKNQLYEKILNSKNKNFGGLLHTSES